MIQRLQPIHRQCSRVQRNLHFLWLSLSFCLSLPLSLSLMTIFIHSFGRHHPFIYCLHLSQCMRTNVIGRLAWGFLNMYVNHDTLSCH